MWIEQRLVPVPGAAHQVGLAREQDGVTLAHESLGMTHARLADLVKVRASARVAEDGDEAHQRPRRSRRKPNSVAAMVRTTSSDFFPRSFDSPLARGRMSTGTSSTRIFSSLSRSS